MRGQISEILIGIAVLVVLMGFIGWRYNPTIIEDNEGLYITADFDHIGALNVGDSVRMGGVIIGNITSVKLDPETYRAHIIMKLTSMMRVPNDSSIKIVSDGLIGGAHVEIDIGGAEENIADGGEFSVTQDAINLIELIGRQFFSTP